MSKKITRIFACLLSLTMALGLFAMVPTVNAAEVGESDIIFNLDFSNYKTGDPIVDTVTDTVIMESGPEARPAFADQNGVTRDGIYMDHNKETNGICWTSDVLDPMKNTEGGFTLNMWVYFQYKNKNTRLFTFAGDIAAPERNNLIMCVQYEDNNSVGANVCNGPTSGSLNIWGNDGNVFSKSWYMLTMEQDPETNDYYFYINGANKTKVKKVTDYTVFDIANAGGEDRIAKYSIGGVTFDDEGKLFNPAPSANAYDVMGGVLSNVTMYGRALTATEIKDLYEGKTYDDADYTAVNTAIEEAGKLVETDYTAESWAALQTAIAAVETGLTADRQSEVDAMAAAINKAVENLVPKGLDISISISDGVVVPADTDGKYNLTWNAGVGLGEGLTLDEVNAQATFTGYGVYYGTSEEAVAAVAAGETSDSAKVMYFNQGDDINVYTIFGFRLKNVAADRTRAAQFFITYEMNGHTYTVVSDSVSAVATVAE